MSRKDTLDGGGTPGPGRRGPPRGDDDLSRGGTAGGTGSPGAGEYSPGSRIAGRYRVEACLGRGGMGEVYRVVDEAKGRVVALKLMREALLDSEDARGRFLREAQISREMDHPGIVRTIDIGTDGSRDFFTMEYLSGGSLRQRMEERRPAGRGFSVGEVLEIADQVLAALEYAHGRTVHRDVTPENVMLTAEGRVKLCDFGIAQVMDWERLTKLTMVRGKPYYMAPEQLSGGRVDGRADVYGLGAVLYELLTGKVPAGRFKLPGELRPGVPESLDHAIGRALDESAGARFPAARAMRDALREVAEGIEVDRRRVRALLAQAKEAKAVRKWDEAVEALERARSIAEDRAGVETEIREVKRLEADWVDRTKRAGALRAKALDARKGRRWAEAIGALEETLGLTEDSAVEKELLEARREREESERRAREVERLRSAAREHVRDRRWSEALAVLGEARPLAEDQAAIDREIGEIAEAQRAEEEARRARARARARKVTAVTVVFVLAALAGGVLWVVRAERLAREERAVAPVSLPAAIGASMAVSGLVVALALFCHRRLTAEAGAIMDLPSVPALSEFGSPRATSPETEPGTGPASRASIVPGVPSLVRSAGGKLPPILREWDDLEILLVPAGEFAMGSDKGAKDERPRHKVHLDDYYIAKHPITNAQYAAFVKETGYYRNTEYWSNSRFNDPNQPVVGVIWDDTQAFCEWLSRKTGKAYRLPTEAEWEKAARGTDERKYPWGNEEPDRTFACFALDHKQGKPDPVGSYPKGVSPYGCHDMAGNVLEWCLDWYDEKYYRKSPSRSPKGPSNGLARVLRGGSWYFESPGALRGASRRGLDPSYRVGLDLWVRHDDLGFRCARDGN